MDCGLGSCLKRAYHLKTPTGSGLFWWIQQILNSYTWQLSIYAISNCEAQFALFAEGPAHGQAVVTHFLLH